MAEKSNVEVALEAISKQMAEMKDKFLPADEAKRIMDKVDALTEQREKDAADLEKVAREKMARNPSVAPAKGRGYNLLAARRDFQKGNRNATPQWDDETEAGFADFMRAVAQKDHRAIKEMYAKANAPYTETTSAGGYLVPEIYRPELIRAQYVKSLALQLCKIVPMSTDTTYLPTVSAGTTAVWGTINTATGDTKVTFGQVTLSAYKLWGISYVPNELMNDSVLGMGALLADEFADSFARRIDHEAWTGDASDADDVFEGWGRAATTNRESSGVSGDSANGSIATDHILNVIGKLSSTALSGAVWIMPPTVWARVRGLADSNSDLLVNIDQDYRFNLFGFPVYLTDQMVARTSVAAGDELMLFGNPKNYIIGDRQQLMIDSSPHVAFNADQTVFRATQRMGMSIGIETELAVLSRATAAGGSGPAA